MEKNHEARRSVIRIVNLAYMVNRRGRYIVSVTLNNCNIYCSICKKETSEIATVTDLVANLDNVEEMEKIIELLSKYHGENYK